MNIKKSKITFQGAVIASIIAVIFIAVTVISVFSFPFWGLNFFVRLLGLWGYIFLAIAAAMSPYLKNIYRYFGKPFIKIHHIFAFSGLIIITLHPVFFSLQAASAAVFIPDFSSWYSFWLYAGRPALIILYISLVAALFRKKIKPWRIIHALMYIMVIFGFIHAVLIGTDFENKIILTVYALLAIAVFASFILKRIQIYQKFLNNK